MRYIIEILSDCTLYLYALIAVTAVLNDPLYQNENVLFT